MRVTAVTSIIEAFLMCHLSIGLTIPVTQLTSFYKSIADYSDVLLFTENKIFPQEFYGSEGALSNSPSYISMRDISFLKSEIQLKIFCTKESHAITIQLTNTSSFPDLLLKVGTFLNCTAHLGIERPWIPYIFFIWPKPISSRHDFEDEIIQTYSLIHNRTGNAILVNSEVYVVITDPDGNIRFYELYSIQNNIFLQKIRQLYRDLVFQGFPSKVVRRTDFRGAKVRAAGQEKSSFFRTVVFNEVNGELLLADGFNADYFKTMAAQLNISVTGVRAYGIISPEKNGSLGGLGQQLLDGEAEVSIMHSEFLPYRAKHLAFLHPHFVSRLTAYFKQPTSRSMRDIYVGSIKTELRLAVICTWVILLVCLIVISAIQRSIHFENGENLPDKNMSDALMWGVAAFCQQGSPVQPFSVSMKTAVFVSLIFSVITYIGFSASVVSQLSVPVIPIKAFGDILQNDMDIYMDNLTYSVRDYLNHAVTHGIIKPMSERIISTGTAIEKISEGTTTAYLSVGDEFYLTASFLNYTEKVLCETVSEVSVDPIGLPVLTGMYVPKNSPYLEYFKYTQLKMRECGIHQRLHSNYLRLSTPRCQRVRALEPPELGLYDTLTAFTFLFVLMIISLFLLGVEVCLRQIHNTPSTTIVKSSWSGLASSIFQS